MTETDVLAMFRETGALLEGHFILRSGLHSRQFFQCAKVLQYPSRSQKLCLALAERVRDIACDSVISPAMGGILVGHDVARALDRRHVFAEKDQGALVIRRFEVNPGERFLVAEDVITTGSAVREVCRLVREAGGVVTGVACIVDRSGDVPPVFGAPLVSLLRMKVETFPPDALPADLQAIPAIKPGSR